MNENWMKPIWMGDTVYEETVIYIEERDGSVEAAPLLYQPDRILKVTSGDGQTVYQEERDYKTGTRSLIRTEGSSMPLWKYDEYYLTEPARFSLPSAGEPGRYIRYDGGDVYAAHQVKVTYTHRDVWQGPKPVYKGEKLPKTRRLLESGAPLRIVYYGDSLMAGCDCSSMWKIEPMMPPLCDLITGQLRDTWKHEHIWTVNTAIGGKRAPWGIEEAMERIIVYQPDLVIFDFGVNDTQTRPRVFKSQIQKLTETVREKLAQTEFLFMTPPAVNPDAKGWTRFHPYYFWGMQELEDELPGFAAAPTSVFCSYLLANKRFEDMTGNGINHPNDFLVRVYAQVVSACLTPE